MRVRDYMLSGRRLKRYLQLRAAVRAKKNIKEKEKVVVVKEEIKKKRKAAVQVTEESEATESDEETEEEIPPEKAQEPEKKKGDSKKKEDAARNKEEIQEDQGREGPRQAGGQEGNVRGSDCEAKGYNGGEQTEEEVEGGRIGRCPGYGAPGRDGQDQVEAQAETEKSPWLRVFRRFG